jgi:uncharacterized protein YqjF (DUF2071 family)
LRNRRRLFGRTEICDPPQPGWKDPSPHEPSQQSKALAGSRSPVGAMRMRWCDLLFAYWRVEAEALRRLTPCGLELDLFDGQVYAKCRAGKKSVRPVHRILPARYVGTQVADGLRLLGDNGVDEIAD